MSKPDPDAAQRAPITAMTTMADAIRQDPNLPMILMRFHIGGCSMCGFEATDTVAEVAELNGVPLDELVAALNLTPHDA